MTPVVVEEAAGPLAVVSVVIMMTVGVAMIVMETGIVMVTVKTGTTDGMRGVRREVRVQFINKLCINLSSQIRLTERW